MKKSSLLPHYAITGTVSVVVSVSYFANQVDGKVATALTILYFIGLANGLAQGSRSP